MNPASSPQSMRRIRQIFARFNQANPEPKTELHYTTPFELLIAVILSAQSTDKGVNKATASLFKVAHTPDQLLKLGDAGLKEYIKTIGFYNAKAKNILATCRLLVEKHHGRVPQERTELEALPGVGRKTANVVLNTVFGWSTIGVDTHVFRVANRTGIAPGRTPVQVEQKLLAVVPEEYQRNAHHWLVLHGRYVCTAHKPKCFSCLIEDLCFFPHKTVK